MADSILKKHQLDIAVGVELNDAQRKATSTQIKNMASQWQDMLDDAIRQGIEDGARSASLKDVLTQFNAQLKAFKLEPLTITVDELQIMDKPIEHAAKLVIEKLGNSFKGGGLGNIISSEITDSLNTLGGTVDKIYQKMEQSAKKSAQNISKSMQEIAIAAEKYSKKTSMQEIDKAIRGGVRKDVAEKNLRGSLDKSNAARKNNAPWDERYLADVQFVKNYEKVAEGGTDALKRIFGDQFEQVEKYYNELAKLHQQRIVDLNNILAQNDFVGGKNTKNPVKYQFKGGEPWAREKTLQEIKSILSGGLTVKGDADSGSTGKNLNTSKIENDLNQTMQARLDAEKRAAEIAGKIAEIQGKMQKQGLIIYRGINEEDAAESREDGQYEYSAEYWAKDKKTALSYAVGSEDDTHTQLLKTIASPKKPLVLDMEGHDYGEIKNIPALIDTLQNIGLDIRSLWADSQDVSADEIQQYINKFAKGHGYDSVITNNVKDANLEGAPITSTVAILDDSILSTIQAFDVIEGVLQETATKIAEWYHAPDQSKTPKVDGAADEEIETELARLRQEQESVSKDIDKYTKKEKEQRKELEKIQSELPKEVDGDNTPPSNKEGNQGGAAGNLDSESMQILANTIKEALASQGDAGGDARDELAKEDTLSGIYELLRAKLDAVKDETPTKGEDEAQGNVINSESIQQLTSAITNALTLQNDGDKTQLATEATLQNVVRLLNGGLTLEESSAINDEIARLKSDLGLSKNQVSNIADSAEEALLHAISAVENEVKKKDLNVKKKDEAGTNLNTKTGEFSRVRVGAEGHVKIGNAMVEGFSTFGESKNYDASYHTHPSRVAAPSVVDVQGALDGLNTIKTHIIQAGKEVLQMNFGDITKQELQNILDTYRDAANIIKASFEDMSADEVKSKYGSMAERDEAMQVELRKAWLEATQKNPAINTYAEHDMPQYTIPERYIDASQEVKELVEWLAARKTDYMNDDVSDDEWDKMEKLYELDKGMYNAMIANDYQDWYQARDMIDTPSVTAKELTTLLESQVRSAVSLGKNTDDSEMNQKIARLTQLESMVSGGTGIAQENTLQQILQAVNIISRGQVNTGSNSPDSVYEAFRRMLESDHMEGTERAQFMDSKTGNVSNHITGTEGEVLADKLDVLFKNYAQRMNIDAQIHSHAGSNDPYFSDKDLDRFAYDRQSRGINQQILVSDKNISKLDLSKVDDINIEPLLNELKNAEHDFAKLGEIAQKYGAQYQTMQFTDFAKDINPQQLMDFLGVKAEGAIGGSIDKESINSIVGAIKTAITPQIDGGDKSSAVGNVLATENTLSAIKTVVEAINNKVVQGTKTSTSGGTGGKKNAESYAGSQFFPEKIKTQTMHLAKFRAQLMTTGKLTDDVDAQIYELLDGLKKVQNGPDLSKWNQQFLQLKASVGIEDIFEKAEDKISTASYKELIELQKTRNDLELKYTKAKDGSVAKQFYAEQLAQLDGVIAKQEDILINEEQEAKLVKMRIEQERKLGEAKAKASDKDSAKAFREEIKQLRKANNVDLANNSYNAGRRALNDLWKFDDAIDPSAIPEVQQLRAELNNLENQYNAVNRAMQNGDAVTDEEIADLNNSSAAVAEKTAKLKEMLAHYEKFKNGENIGNYEPDIGDEEEQLRKAIEQQFGGKGKIKGFERDASGFLTANVEVKEGARAFTEYAVAVERSDHSIRALKGNTRQLPGFFDSVKRKLSEISQYVSAMSLISRAGQELRKGIQYVRDIDLALTELKKVTDETEETYDKFLDTASKTASKVGSTVKDVISSTADWARLGYSMEQAAQFAESTQILMNVSEFTDVSAATDTLISAVQAFEYTAESSMEVVDLLNTIGKQNCRGYIVIYNQADNYNG